MCDFPRAQAGLIVYSPLQARAIGMSWVYAVNRRATLWRALSAGLTCLLLASVAPAQAAGKKTPKTAAKAPVKARPAAPSPMDREVSRHVRQMGKLNRDRVEAERTGDRKAVTRVAKQVQLELKRHEARRSALAKAAAKSASRPRKSAPLVGSPPGLRPTPATPRRRGGSCPRGSSRCARQSSRGRASAAPSAVARGTSACRAA